MNKKLSKRCTKIISKLRNKFCPIRGMSLYDEFAKQYFSSEVRIDVTLVDFNKIIDNLIIFLSTSNINSVIIFSGREHFTKKSPFRINLLSSKELKHFLRNQLTVHVSISTTTKMVPYGGGNIYITDSKCQLHWLFTFCHDGHLYLSSDKQFTTRFQSVMQKQEN